MTVSRTNSVTLTRSPSPLPTTRLATPTISVTMTLSVTRSGSPLPTTGIVSRTSSVTVSYTTSVTLTRSPSPLPTSLLPTPTTSVSLTRSVTHTVSPLATTAIASRCSSSTASTTTSLTLSITVAPSASSLPTPSVTVSASAFGGSASPTPPVKVFAALEGAGAALSAAVFARAPGPTRAISSCTFNGTTVWWLASGSPNVTVSVAGGDGALALPAGPWPATAQPVSCAVSGAALVVGVANVTSSSCALYTASSLPGNASTPTWTPIANFTGGANLAGFALTGSGLGAYLAVRGAGVAAAARTSAGSSPFGAFTLNSATAGVSAASLVDVLLSATERALYVLNDGALGVVDMAGQAPVVDMAGLAAASSKWAAAGVAPVASAAAGARFAGLALSQ